MESSQNFIINNDNINIVLNQKEEVKTPIIIDKVVKEINIEFLQIKENKKEQKNVLKNNYISENHEKNKIKENIREYLNILVKDNFVCIKHKILEIIRINEDYQDIFLDLLFKKAIKDTFYVEIYSKLYKELINDTLRKKGNKKLSSLCKSEFEEYLDEKGTKKFYYKIKQYYFGFIYFICELIKLKILPKKLFYPLVNYLFSQYEKGNKFEYIYLQTIIIFTDQFGTLIYSIRNNIKENKYNYYKEKVIEIIIKLEKIKNLPTLPENIKYLIINLILKEYNEYKKALYEEYIFAKSKNELINLLIIKMK